LRIGIDLGGTKVEAVAMAVNGEIQIRKRIATPRGDYAQILTCLAKLVADIESELSLEARIGIGIPGAVSAVTGNIKNANSTELIGHDLCGDMQQRTQRPVRISNDANCFALSEAQDGAGAHAQNVFAVILGTGVGGGVVLNGRLVSGCNLIAGEWGHNPLPWPQIAELPGPACYCGRKGCIETFLSGPGLTTDDALESSEPVAQRRNPQTIVSAAEAGEPRALASLERYADRLARALASVINVLDPEVIVLGGGLSNLDYLYRQVPELWSEYVFSDRVDTRLRPPVHGDSSGVRGAAWLWEA